ncbi:MAG: YunC family protein [Kiritimatiellae bacterium]|nr:YunC family protein [Kiritimatiellia bacterium]
MIRQETVSLEQGRAEGHVSPIGPVNLVWVTTPNGMIGCGAFDVTVLERFQYPAARMKGAAGKVVATIEDLLEGEVREANAFAKARGIEAGMTGRAALAKLLG